MHGTSWTPWQLGGDVEGVQLVPCIFGTGFTWGFSSQVGINVNKNGSSVVGDSMITHSPIKVSAEKSE